jgi:hypothetical protein
MARKVAQGDADTIARRLHAFVTHGPWDLDIAQAMSAYGYDAAKWAEGQGVLAELVSSDLSDDRCLTTAKEWYDEAVSIAQKALGTEPHLLVKLGVAEMAAG